MNLKSLRQILKACADDTRLRILHILQKEALTVKDICGTLKVSQPTVSKHLARLRLLKVVADRRIGNLVYYSLNRATNTFQGKISTFIVSQFSDVSAFKKDKEEMRKLRRK